MRRKINITKLFYTNIKITIMMKKLHCVISDKYINVKKLKYHTS